MYKKISSNKLVYILSCKLMLVFRKCQNKQKLIDQYIYLKQWRFLFSSFNPQ